jgi:hypothetical protein
LTRAEIKLKKRIGLKMCSFLERSWIRVFLKGQNMTRGLSTAIFLLGGVIAFFSQGFVSWAGPSNPSSEANHLENESVVLSDWSFTHAGHDHDEATDEQIARHQFRERLALRNHFRNNEIVELRRQGANRPNAERRRDIVRQMKCEKQKLKAHHRQERSSHSISSYSIPLNHTVCELAVAAS